MMLFNFGKYCFGCGACEDVCPVEALTMQKGKDGFCFPIINDNKCINCGLCERVCPHLRMKKYDGGKQDLYCAKNKDEKIRLQSSSGGVFYALAKSHIERMKGVVVATDFDSELQLRHHIVDNVDGVERLMKSKYIQSSTAGVFKWINTLLDNSVPILFVGTPCQCQALINSVSMLKRELLTVVDFVCHGVPSQDLFNRWRNWYERKYDCRVVNVSFREKDGQHVRSFLIERIDNKTKQRMFQKGLPHEWSYYNGFLDHTTFRPSCFYCRFKSTQRNSDITLGDFWGIESIKHNLKDINKGYSMVVVNSRKGKLALERIHQDVCFERLPLSAAVENNHAFSQQDERSKMNYYFLKWYSLLPMSVIDKLFLTSSPSLFWRCVRKLLRTI